MSFEHDIVMIGSDGKILSGRKIYGKRVFIPEFEIFEPSYVYSPISSASLKQCLIKCMTVGRDV